ncbi:MAG: 2'-deoxycytidine 5'-triphosphate deaminase domain-containing protein [Nanoarchaeota archaeon]
MRHSLVDSDILKLLGSGSITSHLPLERFVQPASIDIPIGSTAYLVKQKFLPFSNDVSYITERLTIDTVDLTFGGMLYKGCTYIIPAETLVDLPEDIEGKLSPKSSIGRIDLLVRTVMDHVGLYDTIPAGRKGRLYVEVTPNFNVILHAQDTLNQLMLFSGEDDSLVTSEHLIFDADGRLLPSTFYSKNKLLLTLDLKRDAHVGFKGKKTNNVIDLSRRDHEPGDFFEDVWTEYRDHGKLTLEKDRFYILATKEFVSVPLSLSSEMIPFSNLIGELRVHYAGFFDPGFGYGEYGEIRGRQGVLEIRPHEDITVYDGQPICLMEFYKNTKIPDKGYGFSGNNYHKQEGPQLAKYFLKE